MSTKKQPITLEGIVFTPELIDEIKSWQEDSDMLQSHVSVIDDAISYIARTSSTNDDKEQMAKCLGIIGALSCIKDFIKLVNVKE